MGRANGGKPAGVKGTAEGKDPGMPPIDFPGCSGEETLDEIGWEDCAVKVSGAEAPAGSYSMRSVNAATLVW
ncbi:hypothetical protein QFZ79_001951 [Arthrobacter sp. V4I6]|uniref:hypothetical protein n=1 Tax=unclassified Arthrobacter TaxID=235627 RepID=UPI00277DBAA7|nr:MULTISPECIES: hypothetical protein [unclassified Arthrobacter]MDQ0819660.1 hypothetical protein [Arthrobacter sp. V1I7]MDQ0853840.1 hypothetical protein [Arthrobacter sp. V4I6]